MSPVNGAVECVHHPGPGTNLMQRDKHLASGRYWQYSWLRAGHVLELSLNTNEHKLQLFRLFSPNSIITLSQNVEITKCAHTNANHDQFFSSRLIHATPQLNI